MSYSKILFILILITLVDHFFADLPCIPRKYNYGSVVCVCNATYCDKISKIVKQPSGNYIAYSSSRDGLRFNKTQGKVNEYSENSPKNKNDWVMSALISLQLSPNYEEIIFNVDRSKTYQVIKGFGGAFTDSAGINFKKLGKQTQEKLIESYFSEDGLEYNMGRVPIGGCDFSAKPYAYNMYPENDTKLSNFSLTEEDYHYKIPFIKMAEKAANRKLDLMAAAWSPPPWMKTTHEFGGRSALFPEYYQTWADYHLKFLEAYEKENITFWGVSTGNEPLYSFAITESFNSLGWLPNSQAKWIAENFGPTIKKKYKRMKIITLDDERLTIPAWVVLISENKKTMDYIDGFGIHWYLNKYFPVELADITHDLFNSKFLMATEACTGLYELPYDIVKLGAWYRAEQLAKDMIENFNHWFVGWVDWNLILDEEGGPNWFKNFADACMISFPENDEFVKQPTFYVMGHFSKFVPEGSIRIEMQQTSGADIDKVAFLRPDGGIAVVILNTHTMTHLVTIREKEYGSIELRIPPKSMHTVVYW